MAQWKHHVNHSIEGAKNVTAFLPELKPKEPSSPIPHLETEEGK